MNRLKLSLVKLVGLFALALVLFYSMAAIAQAILDGGVPPSALPTPTTTLPPPGPVDVSSLIQQGLEAFSDFKTGATVAGLMILVHIATNLTKIKALVDKIPPQFRPWIALGLGIVSATIAVKQNGGTWTASLVAGLTVGLGAIGGNELINSQKATNKASDAVGKAIVSALTSNPALVQAGLTDLVTKLERVAKSPDVGDRLDALKTWAKSDWSKLTPAAKS